MTLPPLGEPPRTLRDPQALLAGQLDHCRDVLLRKLDSLPADERTRARLPSGWTPLELLKHLTYVERRWLAWGFLAEPLPEPWGDALPGTDVWTLADDETYEVLRTRFLERVERSREIAAGATLLDVAATGGRFADDAGEPGVPDDEAGVPNLAWILLHLLQEYARHLGHLDVVVELAGGDVGE